MAYQFLGFILLWIILVDILLIGLVVLSTKIKRKQNQRLVYGLAVLGFGGLTPFKLLFVEPHAIASTPVNLSIEAKDVYTTLYYICDYDGTPTVFWKEHIIGNRKEQYFELESGITNGLTIAMKIGGEWESTTLALKQDSTTVLNIAQTAFQKPEAEIVSALKRYKWTELGNYMSNVLTLLFVMMMIWRIRKYGI